MADKQSIKFKVGEHVFVKVPRFPHWLARIEKIPDLNSTPNEKYNVTFLGTNEPGTCKIEDLFKYSENVEKFSKSSSNKDFKRGIKEVENIFKNNPPPEYSDDSEEDISDEEISYVDSDFASLDEDSDAENRAINTKKPLKRKATAEPKQLDDSANKKILESKELSTEDIRSQRGRKIIKKKLHDA